MTLQGAKRVLDSLWLKRKEQSIERKKYTTALKKSINDFTRPKRVLDSLRLKKKEQSNEQKKYTTALINP